jgi:TRAP-type C4-dicarboxylate transport system substrate-binding protein
MRDTFREIAPEQAKWVDEDDAKALKEFERYGNAIYRLSPEEWKEFQKLAPPVWEKFVAQFGGKTGYFLEKLQAAVAAAK